MVFTTLERQRPDLKSFASSGFKDQWGERKEGFED